MASVEKRIERVAEKLADLPPESAYSPKQLEARRMWAAGFILEDIAEHFGIARTTAAQWINDPTGEKNEERKRRYHGICCDCGGETNGAAGGFSKTPKRCRSCSVQHQRANAKWTRATIIDAIQRWAALHGKPPTATAWNVAMKGRSKLDAERFAAGNYPHLYTVQRNFPSWSAAIEAAGFERSNRGGNQKGPNSLTPEIIQHTRELSDLYGRAEAARRLGISPTAVSKRLKKGTTRNMAKAVTPDEILDREIDHRRARVTTLRARID
ncbi:MAG: homing endonuclease associated repeat-containing protein, partial [Solirubrobacterales bacterium]